MLTRLLAAALAAFGLAATAPAAAQGWRTAAVIDASVSALSADGQVAAGTTFDTFEAFRWTARDGLQRLGGASWAAPGHRSGITGLSADGRIVSATIVDETGTATTAGRWAADTGWQRLGPLPADGGLFDGETSSAFAMSGDGQVVAGLYWRPDATDGLAHAMAWTAATGIRDLGSSGRSSRINGASHDGSVLVGWDEHPQFGNRRAAIWAGGVRTVLDDSDWPSEALAVNPAGTVVVGYTGNPADFQTYATRWAWNGQAWVSTRLGVIHQRGATGYAYASALSADGTLIVGGYRPDVSRPTSKGFVWTEATGFVDAAEYFAAQGVRLNPLAPIIGLTAVGAEGRTVAAVTQQRVAPFATRTLLLRPKP